MIPRNGFPDDGFECNPWKGTGKMTTMGTDTISSPMDPESRPPLVKRALLFSVNIRVGEACSIRGKNGQVNMVRFSGDMKAPFYEGKILDGGVDTQKTLNGGPVSFSARYMLEGRDSDGRPARLFIENNGTTIDGEIVTRPTILVDDPALQWLEDVDIEGRVNGGPDGLVIGFYAPEDVVKERLGV